MLQHMSSQMIAWAASSVGERLRHCRSMLYLHGFLTEAENERIKSRLLRAYDAEQALKSRRTPKKAVP